MVRWFLLSALIINSVTGEDLCGVNDMVNLDADYGQCMINKEPTENDLEGTTIIVTAKYLY